MDTIASDLIVSEADVPSNVHPAQSETPVPANINEGTPTTLEPMGVSGNALSEKIDEVEPVMVDFTALFVSALDDNVEMSCVYVHSSAISMK